MIIETSKGKLPVRYSWNALAKFGDLTGKTMDEVISLDLPNMKLSDVLTFILVGFVEGARKAGEECKVSTAEEVGDLLDDDPGLMGKIMEALSEMTKAPDSGEKSKKK